MSRGEYKYTSTPQKRVLNVYKTLCRCAEKTKRRKTRSEIDVKEEMEMGGPPFQKIKEACKTTGLSGYYLRNGCKDGSIPHIKSGGVYYINVPALLEQMGGTAG